METIANASKQLEQGETPMTQSSQGTSRGDQRKTIRVRLNN
jgi:hypothetical protein